MKNSLRSLIAASLIMAANAQGQLFGTLPVIDIGHTAETIAARLQAAAEWAKQAERDLQEYARLGEIRELQELLGKYLGDATLGSETKAALEALIGRVDQALAATTEAELLEIIAEYDSIHRESPFYSELPAEHKGTPLEYKEEDFRRHAAIESRLDTYRDTQGELLGQMEAIETQLADAASRGKSAESVAQQNEVIIEQQALLGELEVLRTKLSMHRDSVALQDIENRNQMDKERTAYRQYEKARREEIDEAHETSAANLPSWKEILEATQVGE